VTQPLLDMTTTLSLLADPAFPTPIAPTAGALVYANHRFRRRNRVITMDTDKVPAQVVFSTERSSAGVMRADVRFQPIGVMRRHVRFEIVRTGKGYK
jgi:hypothetical protein